MDGQPSFLGAYLASLAPILQREDLVEIAINPDGKVWIERKGGSHLFLVDGKQTRYVDCQDQPLPYGPQLVDDVLNRTETAMPQAHCFLAMELALRAQAQAQRVSFTA